MKTRKSGFDKDLTRKPGEETDPVYLFLQEMVVPLKGKATDFHSPGQAADDLVFQAMETEDPEKAFALVETALLLYPDCIRAYEFLGDGEVMPALSIPYYAYGVQIGRRLFGGSYLKQNKGLFYGLLETRPFMRCLYRYGRNCYFLGRKEECIAVYQELIDLNPNDNQGVRYELGAFLLEQRKLKDYASLRKQYADETDALLSYSDVLYAFLKHGDDAAATTALQTATEANASVVKYLLAKNPPKNLPDSYSWGSDEEARIYAAYAWWAWQSSTEALDWLRRNKPKARKSKPGR